MAMMEKFNSRDFDESMTKQSFKDQTDINKILYKAARGDAISHLAKHGATYGDFSDVDDLLTAHERLQKGTQIFEELPAEVKREFDQSPQKFFNFVNDPQNVDKLAEVLPGLAAEGNQRPQPRRTLEVESQIPEPQPPSEAPQAAVEGGTQ